MELSSSNIRKFLIFSQKKAFLIFWETETPQKFFIFQEELPKSQKPKFLCQLLHIHCQLGKTAQKVQLTR